MLKTIAVTNNIIFTNAVRSKRRSVALDNIHLALVHPAMLVPVALLFDRPEGRRNLAARKREFPAGDEVVLSSSL